MFDVVTISGGVTRSHTLSDLRPATEYEVFIVPFFRRIKGMPSNLRKATTKEDGECHTFSTFQKATQVN